MIGEKAVDPLGRLLAVANRDGEKSQQHQARFARRLAIGSEEAAASVCPQNRAYGSVHGSSRKTYPLMNIKPVRQLLIRTDDLSHLCDKPPVGVSFGYREGI